MSPSSRIANIHVAARKGRKGRVLLSGPAGSGKTWTALQLAFALVPDGNTLVIDTERESSGLYATDFPAFAVLPWEPPYDPNELAAVLRQPGNDYATIIIDSLTHFWRGEGGTLDVVDAAAARAKGNSYAGWKAGTPAQNALVDAMLQLPSHLIATVRSKMEYVQERDDHGKTAVRKIGMAPVQRDDLEYDMTVAADLDVEHRLAITKTRCHPLADKVYKAGQAAMMGETLRDWLSDNVDAGPGPERESLLRRLNAFKPPDRRKAIKETFALRFGVPSGVADERLADADEFLRGYEADPDPDPEPDPPAAAAPQKLLTNAEQEQLSRGPRAAPDDKTVTVAQAKRLHVVARDIDPHVLDVLIFGCTGGRSDSAKALTEREMSSVTRYLNEVRRGSCPTDFEAVEARHAAWLASQQPARKAARG